MRTVNMPTRHYLDLHSEQCQLSIEDGKRNKFYDRAKLHFHRDLIMLSYFRLLVLLKFVSATGTRSESRLKMYFNNIIHYR